LAWGIAAALAYENPNDNEAVQLRETLSQKGLAGALSSVCGIQEDAPLAALVGSRYRDIVNLQIP
jgi:mannitol-1-phosphate 5-dehydrogenase